MYVNSLDGRRISVSDNYLMSFIEEEFIPEHRKELTSEIVEELRIAVKHNPGALTIKADDGTLLYEITVVEELNVKESLQRLGG